MILVTQKDCKLCSLFVMAATNIRVRCIVVTLFINNVDSIAITTMSIIVITNKLK